MLTGIIVYMIDIKDDFRHLIDDADKQDAVNLAGLKELCDWLDSNHVRYTCKRFGWRTRIYISEKNTKNVDISVFEKALAIVDKTNKQRLALLSHEKQGS